MFGGDFLEYIGKKEKINYYAGLTGQNMVYSLIGGSFFNYFMTDIALFPALTVSVLLIVMKIWDGVNDPIVGSFIDKHTFKNGEKLRPFLKYTPLPVGIFTVLIFVVFSTKEDLLWLRVSYFIIMYICWDLAYTVQDVAIWGITSCVSPNTDERDRFVQWARTIGSCVYGALGTLIPMALEMIANATGSSMALMTLVFALIFGFGGAMLSLRCYGARERVRVVKEKQQVSIAESFSLLFKNRMLMLLTLGNILGSVGFGANLVTYFFKYEIPADFLGENSIIGALGLTTVYYMFTALPGFLGMMLADKIKKFCKGYVNAIIMMQAANIGCAHNRICNRLSGAKALDSSHRYRNRLYSAWRDFNCANRSFLRQHRLYGMENGEAHGRHHLFNANDVHQNFKRNNRRPCRACASSA